MVIVDSLESNPMFLLYIFFVNWPVFASTQIHPAIRVLSMFPHSALSSVTHSSVSQRYRCWLSLS